MEAYRDQYASLSRTDATSSSSRSASTPIPRRPPGEKRGWRGKSISPSGSRLLSAERLLLPSLGVHALHQQPEHDQHLPDAKGQNPAEMGGPEPRRKKRQKRQTGQRHQRAENP